MTENLYFIASNGELYHYGIKGQKWGVRRYQNKDGSLTPEGKKRLAEYIDSDGNYTEKGLKTRFDKRVEIGTKMYIYRIPIVDPLVRHVIMSHKDEIDRLVNAQLSRKMNDEQVVQQSIAGAQFAQNEAIRASNQAASLSISGGTNPFMFG